MSDIVVASMLGVAFGAVLTWGCYEGWRVVIFGKPKSVRTALRYASVWTLWAIVAWLTGIDQTPVLWHRVAFWIIIILVMLHYWCGAVFALLASSWRH